MDNQLYPLPLGFKIVFGICILALEIPLWRMVVIYFTHTKELERRYWGKNRKWMEEQVGRAIIAGIALIIFAVIVLKV